MTGPRAFCNGRAQQMAAQLNVPAVGGSDAHSLATIGTGYTHFAGTSASDLYRSIVQGQVSWGGQSWSIGQYLEVGWLSMRQRTAWGALKLALTDLPLFQRPHVSVSHPGAAVHSPVPVSSLAPKH